MLYIYAVQRALPQYRDFRIAGEIVYPNRTVRVLQGGLPASFITDLGASCWPFLAAYASSMMALLLTGNSRDILDMAVQRLRGTRRDRSLGLGQTTRPLVWAAVPQEAPR